MAHVTFETLPNPPTPDVLQYRIHFYWKSLMVQNDLQTVTSIIGRGYFLQFCLLPIQISHKVFSALQPHAWRNRCWGSSDDTIPACLRNLSHDTGTSVQLTHRGHPLSTGRPASRSTSQDGRKSRKLFEMNLALSFYSVVAWEGVKDGNQIVPEESQGVWNTPQSSRVQGPSSGKICLINSGVASFAKYIEFNQNNSILRLKY